MNRFFRYAVSFVTLLSLLLVLTACGAETQREGTDADRGDAAIDPTEYPAGDAAPSDPAALQTKQLPGEFPKSFSFLSGAGGWSTDLVLEADAAFYGTYHDSDMGDRDETEYPNGTFYLCTFSGRFGEINQVNDFTWTMSLADLMQSETRDEQWIEDGIRYVGSYPYGLDGGQQFTFYTPDAPISVLSEDEYFWYPYRWDRESETLDCYCIRNDATGECFFSELISP